MQAVAEGKVVGYQGADTCRPIYAININGSDKHSGLQLRLETMDLSLEPIQRGEGDEGNQVDG